MGEPTIDQLAVAIGRALNETAKRQWPAHSWSKTPGHFVYLAATAVHELLNPAAPTGNPTDPQQGDHHG